MHTDRIRFVAANFYQLQGLRLLPIGGLLLYAGASSFGWLDWLPGRPAERPGDLGNAWGLLALFVALVAAMAARDYYRHHYGGILPFRRTRRNALLGLAIVTFLTLMVADRAFAWPLLLAPLFMTGSLTTTVLVDGWLRAHYLIGAALYLGLSLFPIVQPHPETVIVGHYLVGGVTLIACGLGDHWVITRTFARTSSTRPSRGKDLDATDATAV